MNVPPPPLSPLRSGVVRPAPRSPLPPLSPPHFEDGPASSSEMDEDLRRHIFANSPSSPAVLAKEFSDLALNPPPGKIRRRNAVTETEIFPFSQALQRFRDHQSPDEGALHKDMANLSLRQRKKATPRSSSLASSPPGHLRRKSSHLRRRRRSHKTDSEDEGDGDDRQQMMQIELHKDLENFPRPKMAHEALADQLRKRQATAVVLYKAPKNLLEEIVAKSQETDMVE